MKVRSLHWELRQFLFACGLEPLAGDLYVVAKAACQQHDWFDSRLPSGHLVDDLDEAIGKCTANAGDVILVAAGHTETANTQITCDIAGIKIIGLGHGADIPTITANASAADCFNVSAASVYLKNIKVVGAASCTALVNVAAADFVAEKCVFQQIATPLMGITITADGDRFTFKDCLFYALVDGPDCAIDLEGKIAGPSLVQNCIFNYSPAGLDLSGIRCNGNAVASLVVDNCIFVGMETTAIDINSSDTDGGDGLIANCSVGAKGTVANIDTLIDAGGCILINNYGSDTASEGGGLIPVTTPA